jgi:hypothetical protein
MTFFSRILRRKPESPAIVARNAAAVEAELRRRYPNTPDHDISLFAFFLLGGCEALGLEDPFAPQVVALAAFHVRKARQEATDEANPPTGWYVW